MELRRKSPLLSPIPNPSIVTHLTCKLELIGAFFFPPLPGTSIFWVIADDASTAIDDECSATLQRNILKSQSALDVHEWNRLSTKDARGISADRYQSCERNRQWDKFCLQRGQTSMGGMQNLKNKRNAPCRNLTRRATSHNVLTPEPSYTLHPTPCALRPTPYALHPTHSTTHPAPHLKSDVPLDGGATARFPAPGGLACMKIPTFASVRPPLPPPIPSKPADRGALFPPPIPSKPADRGALCPPPIPSKPDESGALFPPPIPSKPDESGARLPAYELGAGMRLALDAG